MKHSHVPSAMVDYIAATVTLCLIAAILVGALDGLLADTVRPITRVLAPR